MTLNITEYRGALTLRLALPQSERLPNSTRSLSFTDAATGEPVDDLQPFLAAAGHIVVVAEDGSGFIHTHAEVEDENGNPVFALPKSTFGPELDFHVQVDEPGLYKLWGQFRTAEGMEITVPFVIEAR